MASYPNDGPRRGAGYERWRASGKFPASVRREALHEAAHATVATIVGNDVELLTLSAYGPEDYPFCRVSHRHFAYANDDDHRRLALHALAGPAIDYADGRIRGDWRYSSRVRMELRDDRRAARELVGDEEVARLWRVALRLVSRYRRAIERLAAALLDEETLDGERVRTVLRECAS